MAGTWRSWALTHVGTVRGSNEDTLVDRPEIGLWAVADGAGGHDRGEVASGLLADMLNALPQGLGAAELMAEVRAGVAAIHGALRARAESDSTLSGAAVTIASTIVVFLVSGAHHACLWAGDRRAYLLRGGALTQLTWDHSMVQDLIDQGLLSEAAAESHPHANVITRAVGAGTLPPDLDKVTGQAQCGDRFLLCSDGLTRTLARTLIGRLMTQDEPAAALIAAALDHGARDNVTAVVAEYGGMDGTVPPPDDEADHTVRLPSLGA